MQSDVAAFTYAVSSSMTCLLVLVADNMGAADFRGVTLLGCGRWCANINLFAQKRIDQISIFEVRIITIATHVPARCVQSLNEREQVRVDVGAGLRLAGLREHRD